MSAQSQAKRVVLNRTWASGGSGSRTSPLVETSLAFMVSSSVPSARGRRRRQSWSARLFLVKDSTMLEMPGEERADNCWLLSFNYLPVRAFDMYTTPMLRFAAHGSMPENRYLLLRGES